MYGEVPPDSPETVKVVYCPWSITVFVTESSGVASAELTGMLAVFTELANAFVVGESIVSTFAFIGELPDITALDWNVNVVDVDDWNASGVFVIELNTTKLYVYGNVPPDSPETVRVSYWPWTSTELDTDSIGVVSGVLTTMFAELIEFAKELVGDESIVMTFALIGELPVITAFVCTVNVVDVDDWNAIGAFVTELNR